MALEMKVYKDLNSYQPKPMFGMTWRQLGAAVYMVVVGGGVFALFFLMFFFGLGIAVDSATVFACLPMLVVCLPAAMWAWWRPKGLRPEKYLGFALRGFFSGKDIVYGPENQANSTVGPAGAGGESVGRRSRRASAWARKKKDRATAKKLRERA